MRLWDYAKKFKCHTSHGSSGPYLTKGKIYESKNIERCRIIIDNAGALIGIDNPYFTWTCRLDPYFK